MIVIWEDALKDPDFDGKPEEAGETAIVHDIGFLVKKNRDKLVLAGAKDPDGKTVRWIMTIPSKLVKQIITLEEKKDAQGQGPTES